MAAAAAAGVPLDVIDLDAPEVSTLYERRLVLVRPDGHVAWRADAEPTNAGALIDVVRGQLLPTISLVGDLNRSYAPSVSLRGSRQDTASLVAQLTVPLYEGGLIWSQTRQAEQTVGQRRSLDEMGRIAENPLGDPRMFCGDYE